MTIRLSRRGAAYFWIARNGLRPARFVCSARTTGSRPVRSCPACSRTIASGGLLTTVDDSVGGPGVRLRIRHQLGCDHPAQHAAWLDAERFEIDADEGGLAEV